MAVSKQIDENNYNSFVFDSLDTMDVYNDWKIVIQFIHSLIGKNRRAHKKFVLFAMGSNKDSEIVKELYMLVDNVIHLSSKNEYI